MSNIINKGVLEKALKEAGRKSVSWQSWPKYNRSGQVATKESAMNQDDRSRYEVSRFKIPMRELLTLPREQRALLLVATKISNEILLLQRQAIVCENGVKAASAANDFDERHGQIAMLFMTLTLLTGKLWEAHQALKKLSKHWRVGGSLMISAEGVEAWKALNRTLGNNSALDNIRNKISFHFDPDALCDQLTDDFDGGHFNMMLSTDYTNTLYLTTDAVSAFAVLELIGPNLDKQAAMNKFFGLVIDNADLMMKFSTEAVLAVLDQVSSFKEGPEIKMDDRPVLGSQISPFLVQPQRRKNK